jgi:hypothetical protein
MRYETPEFKTHMVAAADPQREVERRTLLACGLGLAQLGAPVTFPSQLIRPFRAALVAVAVSAACGHSAAAAPARSASPAAGPVQFVVGTYSLAGRPGLGTAWGWHASTAADVTALRLPGLALTGPPHWNNDAPTHGCAVFRGGAHTLCLGWQWIKVRPGEYSAGNWSATPVVASRIRPPHILLVAASGRNVSVAWAPVPRARSYLVAVTDPRSPTCCDLQSHVVPASARSFLLTNVPMKRGQRYRVGVFAVSADVTRNAGLNGPFDIGEARATVVAGGPAKRSGTTTRAGRINAQVHGTAAVSGSSVKIVDLRVEGLPARTTVVFRCVKGCSVSEVLSGTGTVHSRALPGVTVRSGSVIEVRATKARYTGFYDRLVIHSSALGFFTEKKLCISPNGTTPHVCKNGQ